MNDLSRYCLYRTTDYPMRTLTSITSTFACIDSFVFAFNQWSGRSTTMGLL